MSGGISPESFLPTMKAYASGRSSPPKLDQLVSDWEMIKAVPHGRIALIRAQQLFFKWGALDGKGAVSEALPFCPLQKGTVDLLYFAVLGWSAVDPDGAMAWVYEFLAAEEATLNLNGVVDLHRMALVGFVVSGREEEALAHWLRLNDQWEGTVEEFYAQKMNPGGVYALASLAKKDRDSALSWIEAHRSECGLGRLQALYEAIWIELSERDPKAAADEAAALPAGEVRKSLLEKVVRWWGVDDAVAASSWLKSQSLGPDFDAAIVQIVDSLADKDLEETRYWLELLEDPSLKNAAICGSYASFRALDPAESALILSLYDPSVTMAPDRQVRRFGNEFAWLSELGEDLACWSAYDKEAVAEYMESIDFLDSNQKEVLKSRFEYALHGEWQRETLTKLLNRYFAVLGRRKVSSWKSTSQIMGLMNYTTNEQYADCLVALTRYWAEYEPEVVRYFLQQQKVFVGEDLERALSVLDSK